MLLVTGYRVEDGLETLLLHREDRNGLRYAGQARLGLDTDARARLRETLHRTAGPRHRRSKITPVAPDVRVRVAAHGGPDRPLRDPVIRELLLD